MADGVGPRGADSVGAGAGGADPVGVAEVVAVGGTEGMGVAVAVGVSVGGSVSVGAGVEVEVGDAVAEGVGEGVSGCGEVPCSTMVSLAVLTLPVPASRISTCTVFVPFPEESVQPRVEAYDSQPVQEAPSLESRISSAQPAP